MKKKNVINLIKYHSENNEEAFRNEAYEIAYDFDQSGEKQLASYILTMVSDNTFVPQYGSIEFDYLTKLTERSEILLLPDAIRKDLMRVATAISKKDIGVNKFIFQGAPGTGKTEAVKQLGNILNRDVYMVNTSQIIDSKLGQTQKNIDMLFNEIGGIPIPEKIIILFDEIDSLALDRTNSNDIREMGRATTELLKGIDYLSEKIILIATTNLYEYFDKAITRRFDYVVDFNRYKKSDLFDVAEGILDFYLSKYKFADKDLRLFRKILNLMDPLPYPAELKNLIKTSIAFSDMNNRKDYLVNLYATITGHKPDDLKELKEQGFTVREIEILTDKSKSSVSRELRGEKYE